jgi:iron complex outermembrane receptor protein
VLQLYYNHDQKDYDPGSGRVNTADVDFQHRFAFTDKNDIVWGVEYKYISDEYVNSRKYKLDPVDREQHFVSTFIQDDYAIAPQRLVLTLGSKFEHNQITGLEIQPSLRIRYTPNKIHSFWGAVSRAIRVPSRIELDGIEYEVDEDQVKEVLGNDQLTSEKLVACEMGHRWQPNNKIWFNTAIFYNDYNDLIGEKSLSPDLDTLTYELANNKNGRSYGLELASDWQLKRNLLLGLSYTYLHNDIDQSEEFEDSGAPRNILSVRSLWDITSKLNFDLWLRYVDNVPEKNVTSYTTLDVRLAYQLLNGLELSLVGQNLFAARHQEFSELEVDRSIYAKIDWQF